MQLRAPRREHTNDHHDNTRDARTVCVRARCDRRDKFLRRRLPFSRRRFADTALTPAATKRRARAETRQPDVRETTLLVRTGVRAKRGTDFPCYKLRSSGQPTTVRALCRTLAERAHATPQLSGTCARRRACFGIMFVTDPQSGVVQDVNPRTAMCVRNVDVHVSCSSHVDALFAAFFIDPQAK
jgi:hypothetical protein